MIEMCQIITTYSSTICQASQPERVVAAAVRVVGWDQDLQRLSLCALLFGAHSVFSATTGRRRVLFLRSIHRGRNRVGVLRLLRTPERLPRHQVDVLPQAWVAGGTRRDRLARIPVAAFWRSGVLFIALFGIVGALANIGWLLVVGVNEQRWREQAAWQRRRSGMICAGRVPREWNTCSPRIHVVPQRPDCCLNWLDIFGIHALEQQPQRERPLAKNGYGNDQG